LIIQNVRCKRLDCLLKACVPLASEDTFPPSNFAIEIKMARGSFREAEAKWSHPTSFVKTLLPIWRKKELLLFQW